MISQASQATIDLHGDTLTLLGTVSFDNVVELTKEGLTLLANNHCSKIDLGQLEQFDSSILALMVAWRRLQKFKIINRPQLLGDLSRVCGLENILPWG